MYRVFASEVVSVFLVNDKCGGEKWKRERNEWFKVNCL
jgi:hypothetical protein